MSKIKFYKDSAKTQQVYPELDPEEMSQKANIDGYYEEMAVGVADNLSSRGDSVPAFFRYRTSGGDADIADGNALIDKIKGRSIVWNQLARRYDQTNEYYTIRVDENYIITLTFDTTGDDTQRYATIPINSGAGNTKNRLGRLGHTYYTRFYIYKTSGALITRAYINTGNQQINLLPRGTVVETHGNAYSSVYLPIPKNATGQMIFSICVFDLTRMFGAGNELSMNEFDYMFPDNCIPDTEETIINLNDCILKTVGFNQWDEEWELGQLVYDKDDPNWGKNRFSSGGIRSKNYIKVFNQTYYCTKNTSGPVYVLYYDENYNPILNPLNGMGYIGVANTTFTPPEKTKYIRFYTPFEYGTVYKNDICINLAWSGYRNGEYESYWAQEKALSINEYFPEGMKSTPVAYDELTKERAISRVGTMVFDGSSDEEWVENPNVAEGYHAYYINNIKNFYPDLEEKTDSQFNGRLTYNTYSYSVFGSTMAPFTFGLYRQSNVSWIVFSGGDLTELDTLAKFKALLQSRPLVINYTKNVEVTTDIEIPLNMSYKVSDFGTEEVIFNVDDDSKMEPLSLDIIYGMNATDTLRRLPENYVSKDSMNNFLDTLGESTQSNWDAEYNEETGQYNYGTDLDLTKKANIDGYYEEMTVGAADNLTGKGTGVPAIFIYRTTGGDEDVADGIASIKSIKGNTLVWNQLFAHGNFDSNPGFHCEQGASLSISNNIMTVTVNDMTTSGAVLVFAKSINWLKDRQGHKILLKFDYKGDTACDAVPTTTLYEIYNQSPWTSYQLMNPVNYEIPSVQTYWQRYESIFTLKDFKDDELFKNIYITTQLAKKKYNSGKATMENGYNWYIKDYMVIDLTQIFGVGNEPATTAEFRYLFPSDYYNYDTGSFINFKGESLKTVGFNQWDEEWEVGSYSVATGQKVNTLTNCIRFKNLIPVFPNTTYYKNSGYGGFYWILYYDENKKYLRYAGFPYKGLVQIPDDVYYIASYTESGYGNVYKHDFCFNLSWSGYRNGEYEEYWTQTKDLPILQYFPTGMNSSNGVYDELTQNKSIQRTKRLVLNGTENWKSFVIEPSGLGRAILDVPDMLNTQSRNDFICDKLPVVNYSPAWTLPYNCISPNTNGSHSILIYLQNASSLDDIKAQLAANPIEICYKFAVPIETEFEEPLNLNYKVSDFGTEEISPNNIGLLKTSPFNGNIAYGINASDTIRRLPESYISEESMEAFLSALNTATNGTWTMTYNSETGKYGFTFTPSQE